MSELHVLRKAKCSSLSNKSTLTYEVSVDKNRQLYFRVIANTGGGIWSTAPVAYADIAAVLAQNPDKITSFHLFKLTKGRSANSAGFLLAALRNEGLVKLVKGRQRKHELCDPKPFMDRINELMSGDTKPKTARKKATVKNSRVTSSRWL